MALGFPDAEPWFRRDGTALVAVPMKKALQELFRIHEVSPRNFRPDLDGALGFLSDASREQLAAAIVIGTPCSSDPQMNSTSSPIERRNRT